MATGAPISPAAFAPLDPAHDAAVGAWLGAEGAAQLAAWRAADDTDVLGLTRDGGIVAWYVLQRVRLMNEVPAVAVAPDQRRQGLGRACLQDALRRSGKRPLVAEADEGARAFLLAIGFKLVGKRKGADGEWRYRLGWHAPRPGQSGGSSVLRPTADIPRD